jgi:hypothetical protein
MNVPRYKGKAEVIEAFDTYAEQPYFSIWNKTAMYIRYNGEDFEEAKDRISHIIDSCVKEGDTAVLTLRLHADKDKTYTTKSPTYANFSFLCSDTMPAPAIHGSDVNAVLLNEINNLRAEVNALKMQNSIDDDDNDDDENNVGGIVGQVQQICEMPIVSQALGALISKWSNGTQRVNNLAGTDVTIDECVKVLFSKGVTIKHLQKLAEMPEAKIKMLLTML